MPVFLDQNAQALVGLGAFAWSATYIAILLVMAVVLSANVARQRKPKQIGLGDGGDKDIFRAMRIHGNFVENAPLVMAALVMLPLLGAQTWMIHLVGGMIVIGRVLHAIGISQSAGASFGRIFGMVLTYSSMLVSAGFLIWFAWR